MYSGESRVDFGVLKKRSKSPLHRQLFELLSGAIKSGVYQPGDRIESERWFVKHAQLSQPTVARAFRDLAKAGWVVRRTGSGTYVNDVQAEDTKVLKRIGVSYYDIKTPYFEKIYAGIRAVTHTMDIELVLVPTGYNFEHEEEAIHAIEQGQVDGIIVIPFGTEPMQRHLSHLVKIGMPVVAVGVHMPHLLCDAVEFDYELSGSLVAEHLLIQHHRRLAFFCTEVLYPNTSNLEMANGIRQACREVDVEFDDANIIRAPIFFRDEENSRPWAELTKMFDQPANLRPTALICETDGLAKVAYDVFGELGLKVPRDVSVTGGGDLPIASQLDPPLTTIAWPLERIGRTALRMLMDRAERRDRQPIHRVLDTNLVVRRSTNMSSTDDLERVIEAKPSSSRSKSRKA